LTDTVPSDALPIATIDRAPAGDAHTASCTNRSIRHRHAELTDEILKCQLKPVDVKEYGGKPSASEIDQPKQIFPRGVRDYSKPSETARRNVSAAPAGVAIACPAAQR